MKAAQRSSYQWVYSLTVFLLVGGTFLRTLLSNEDNPRSMLVSLGLLVGWAGVFLSESFFTRRWRGAFHAYLVIQSVLIILLLQLPEDADYFSVLFAILGMQIMQRYPGRVGTWLIALFTPVIILTIYEPTPIVEASALGLLYTAVNALLGAYALATVRAQQARDRNQQMVRQLQEANQKLQSYTTQIEQLTVARERNHLARELHDSVTQTIFSMTLTTQSTTLLLERNPAQIPGQLEHLNQLAQNALIELQELITRLNPAVPDMSDLAEALRQHIASRYFPDDLKVALNVLAECSLPQPVTRGLFRIIQEALNNIVKHARANQATVSLHLAQPQWVEVEDNGCGFDPACAPAAGKVGLSGMHERAAEIGWNLTITSTPGAGTRIRIEQISSEKGQP